MSDIDYPSRINTNYRMEREHSPEAFIGSTMERMRYDRDYGFEHNEMSPETSSWQTYTTHANGNDRAPVSRISYGRSSRDPDHIAYLAHQRYAHRDTNRFELDHDGSPLVEANGDYRLARDHDRREVSTAQLVHEGAMVSFYSHLFS
jgi:hypothetical protein